ncbi:coniferyl aldehyde dehydrogenase [Acinetobacter silvestris]|uniref:Aldehyde dehydrogenase n=1 Tax=Acinetobacter silvestris TaxID=1977882 RepID=A0A1Y3CMA4_9GAMM|nr:coniferyl aldehyde dehydrogenase [Acinetobacter silvestris]OTG67628.1 coniferyl-aldehyde dehydrogenase [Acinetobacter silvestris]
MDSTNLNHEQTEEVEFFKEIFREQKISFEKDKYPSLKSRKENLNTLKKMIIDNQDSIIDAINQDFKNRARQETITFEILPSVLTINYTLKHLKKWMAPQKRHVHLLFQPGSASIYYQPLGVVGVIVPWNYPLFLAMGPLIQAIAAGNKVMIKMSEFTPHFSLLLKSLIAQYFDKDQISVILGDAMIASEFTQLPFDHLLYTGSTNVGKKVMAAAANNLTPVTLELGGKSPAIVCAHSNIKDAAEKIAYGKQVNAGQTCVAPDYVFIHKDKVTEFVTHYINTIQAFYSNTVDNSDYTAIINQVQNNRLRHYIEDAKSKGATVTSILPEGAKIYIEPTLIQNVDDSMLIMQNEIFGPILPIIAFDDLDEVIEYINNRPRPLALYLFSNNANEQNKVIHETHSGGMCINETVLHVGVDSLPFGGIGGSGMGHYHGYEGFITFSKIKSVYKKSFINLMKFLYPPYSQNTFFYQILKKLFIK